MSLAKGASGGVTVSMGRESVWRISGRPSIAHAVETFNVLQTPSRRIRKGEPVEMSRVDGASEQVVTLEFWPMNESACIGRDEPMRTLVFSSSRVYREAPELRVEMSLSS